MLLEGSLELKYDDKIKMGMSVSADGRPGNVSAFC